MTYAGRIVVVASLLVGCTGSVEPGREPVQTQNPSQPGPMGTPPAPGSMSMPAPQVPVPPASSCTGRPDVGPAPLRFLTRTEYERSVRDLLRLPEFPLPTLPPDGRFEIAVANVGVSITESSTDLYARAAADIAARSMPQLRTLLPCADSGGESCARDFVTRFGLRAFRRPLTTAETDGLLKVFRGGSAGRTFGDGIRLVIQTMLQSGSFLYRVDRTENATGEVRALEPFALASRLSYFLWSSMPDDALLEAAGRDQLRTPEQIGAQVTRMMEDPRAKQTFLSFFARWLGVDRLPALEKNTKAFPQWTAALRASMATEVDGFLTRVLLQGDARLQTLLTDRTTSVDGPLAAIYGLPNVKGTARVPVMLDPAQRAGVFTLPGVLATLATENETNPVQRGLFIRERLLCVHVQPPPPDLMVEPPPPSDAKTTRARFSEHSANPACRTCHVLIDDLGLAFETYDALGRHRTTEHNLPIDPSGTLTAAGDADGPFRNAIEMLEKLGRSRQAEACLTRQWFRFAFAREETTQDACTLARIADAVTAAKGDLRVAFTALATSDAMRYAR